MLIAVGLGLTYVPMTIASVSGVSKNQTGLASGLINTTQQIGGALGLAIAATVANSQTDHYLRAAHHGAHPVGAALTHGFRAGFLVDAGFAALGILAALTLINGIRAAASPTKRPPCQRSQARSRGLRARGSSGRPEDTNKRAPATVGGPPMQAANLTGPAPVIATGTS